MKKYIPINKFTRIGFIAIAIYFIFMSSYASAGIKGSKHDFSQKGWGTTQICVFCHAPHKAAFYTNTAAPLWNHAPTSETFTLYSSPTMNAVVPQPSSSSKLCLSCHDGTIAVDSYGGNLTNHFITGDGLIGTDLSNDHPISITYDAALATADGGLEDPTVKNVPSISGQTIDIGMLIDHKLECASCHDVHNNKGDAENSEYLLLVNNSGSELCLTCHKK